MTDARLPVTLYHREADTPAHLGVGDGGPLCGTPAPAREEAAMLSPADILSREWAAPFCPICVRFLQVGAEEAAGE